MYLELGTTYDHDHDHDMISCTSKVRMSEDDISNMAATFFVVWEWPVLVSLCLVLRSVEQSGGWPARCTDTSLSDSATCENILILISSVRGCSYIMSSVFRVQWPSYCNISEYPLLGAPKLILSFMKTMGPKTSFLESQMGWINFLLSDPWLFIVAM